MPTGGTSINLDLADRLSGQYASGQYVIGDNLWVDGTGDAHPGNLELSVDTSEGAVRGDAFFGHNFNGADSVRGLNIDLRCQPTTTGTTSWTGLLLGSGGPGYDTTINGGLFLAFRGSPDTSGSPNDVFIRENGTNYGYGLLGQTNAFHDFHIQLTGVGSNNPFDGSSHVEVKIYLDGSTTPGIDYTSSFAYANDYIGMISNTSTGQRGLIDSLSISQMAPEPGTLVLLAMGLIGLLAYAWRKRK